MTWPRISFDPVKLFELRVADLSLHDPYFARKWLDAALAELGDDLFTGMLNAPEVVGHYCDLCPIMRKPCAMAWREYGLSRPSASLRPRQGFLPQAGRGILAWPSRPQSGTRCPGAIGIRP